VIANPFPNAEVICSADDRETWLAERQRLVTASDVAAILGLNPWHGALEVYMVKQGLAAETEESEAMEWGSALEPVIAERYAKRTGREVNMCGLLIRSKRYPWLGATLDATTVIAVVPDHRPVSVLEIKTTGASHADDWAEGVPPHIMPQVQTQMIVTGTTMISVACLIGGQRMVWVDVAYDDEMCERIIAATRDFMRRLEEEDPPAPSGTKGDGAALHALYPKEDEGKVIALDQDAVEIDMRLREIAQQLAGLKAEDETLRQKLKAMLGDAVKGVLPGGGAWQWRVQHKDAYSVAARDTRVLRRVKE